MFLLVEINAGGSISVQSGTVLTAKAALVSRLWNAHPWHMFVISIVPMFMGFPGGSVVKNPPANVGAAGDMGLIPGLGRSPGEGKGNAFRYSCLKNPHGQKSLAGVPKSQTQLSTHAPMFITHNTYSHHLCMCVWACAHIYPHTLITHTLLWCTQL